jgi:hypothetical protein
MPAMAIEGAEANQQGIELAHAKPGAATAADGDAARALPLSQPFQFCAVQPGSPSCMKEAMLK